MGLPPSIGFADLIDRLEGIHGTPPPPPSRDPFELLVWEACAYLVEDPVRARVFAELKAELGGLTPHKVLEADPRVIEAAIEGGGMDSTRRAERVIECAELAAGKLGGDLATPLALPLPRARKVFEQFPGIGAPGAEKILLFAGAHPVLALESNGVRALVRLGFAAEQKSYDRTYRALREALAGQVPGDVAGCQRAHQLLRTHGKVVCKASRPRCEVCLVMQDCPTGRGSVLA